MSTPSVKFIYKYADTYNPHYANGAIGGASPSGEIVISFYHERPPLPKTVVHAVNPDGTLGLPTQLDPADQPSSLLRFIDTGVVLSLKTAREVHKWLGVHISELENLAKAKQKPNN